MSWTASLSGREIVVPPGEDAVLYLMLADGGTSQAQFSSAYFNVTVPKESTTTTLPTQSSSLRTQSTAQSSPTAIPQPDSKQNFSSGTVAGISVGATIGGILVLVGLGLGLWTLRKKRNMSNEEDQRQGVGPTGLGHGARGNTGNGDSLKQLPGELDSGPVHELP